jgi:hypothetical protein
LLLLLFAAGSTPPGGTLMPASANSDLQHAAHAATRCDELDAWIMDAYMLACIAKRQKLSLLLLHPHVLVTQDNAQLRTKTSHASAHQLQILLANTPAEAAARAQPWP